jgi:hypothetical protein
LKTCGVRSAPSSNDVANWPGNRWYFRQLARSRVSEQALAPTAWKEAFL